MEIRIEMMVFEHRTAVMEIYRQGIKTGNATFETEVPLWEDWDNDHFTFGRLVAVVADNVVGWSALSGVSKRSVYKGVAEVSIYIDKEYWRKGIGKMLLSRLIGEAERHNIWTLQAGIFPENKTSMALFERLAFRIVGVREKIGKMNNVWRDVALLERRSPTIR